MKKIFTLFAGLLMAAGVFAADRRPVVTVNSTKNFKIVIDGKTYFDNDRTIRIANLHNGRHTIRVYEMKRGIYNVMRERLVSSAAFKVNRDDVAIRINYAGQIDIREQRDHRRFDNDRDWDDRSNRF